MQGAHEVGASVSGIVGKSAGDNRKADGMGKEEDAEGGHFLWQRKRKEKGDGFLVPGVRT